MPANPEKLKLVKEIGRKDILFAVARVPNSGRLFLGSNDGAKGTTYGAEIVLPDPKQLGNTEVTAMNLVGDDSFNDIIVSARTPKALTASAGKSFHNSPPTIPTALSHIVPAVAASAFARAP